jgi:colicin import membrane protein
VANAIQSAKNAAVKAEANAARAQAEANAAKVKAAANAAAAQNAEARAAAKKMTNNAIQKAKNAAEAEKAANNARKAAEEAAAAKTAQEARNAAAKALRNAALAATAATRFKSLVARAQRPGKTLNNFLENWKISGYPKNLIKNVTAENTANFARRFLYSKLQAGRNGAPQSRPYGSKYANKHPWKNIVNSLNAYDLSNSQKNMIRRVNIAMAAQPSVSGLGGKRNAVKFNIKGMNREVAIQKQKNALRAARQARQRQAQSQTFKTRNNPSYNNKKQGFKVSNNPSFNMSAARQHREAFGN